MTQVVDKALGPGLTGAFCCNQLFIGTSCAGRSRLVAARIASSAMRTRAVTSGGNAGTRNGGGYTLRTGHGRTAPVVLFDCRDTQAPRCYWG